MTDSEKDLVILLVKEVVNLVKSMDGIVYSDESYYAIYEIESLIMRLKDE